MLFELVLVAAVLGFVGFAVYQQVHHTKTASTAASLPTTSAAPNTATGLAASAATIGQQDSASDASISNSASAATSQISAGDSDVSNLGATSDASAF